MENLIKIATFLEMEGIANGCGGKWGFRFELVIESIKSLEYFDNTKGQDMFIRIRALCSIHDMLYDLGGNWIIRWIADIWFVIQCFFLFSWVEWKLRYASALSIYIGIRKYGTAYFLYY